MTLNGVIAVILRYFTDFGRFGGGQTASNWFKLVPYCLRTNVALESIFPKIFDDIFGDYRERQR